MFYSRERVTDEVARELMPIPADLAWREALPRLRARGVGRYAEEPLRLIVWQKRRQFLLRLMPPGLARVRESGEGRPVNARSQSQHAQRDMRPAWMDEPMYDGGQVCG